MITMNHRAAEHKAQTLLKELQDEISALKGRSDVLSELAVSDDCFHFLKVSVESKQIKDGEHVVDFSATRRPLCVKVFRHCSRQT